MSIKLTELEIEERAKLAIKNAATQGGNAIIMIGLPPHIPIPEGDQSENVIMNCSNCKVETLGTVVKAKIMELTKHDEYPAQILCTDCLLKEMEKLYGKVPHS